MHSTFYLYKIILIQRAYFVKFTMFTIIKKIPLSVITSFSTDFEDIYIIYIYYIMITVLLMTRLAKSSEKHFELIALPYHLLR